MTTFGALGLHIRDHGLRSRHPPLTRCCPLFQDTYLLAEEQLAAGESA